MATEDTGAERERDGEVSIEEAVGDLMDRCGEIEGIAHAIERTLYHEEGAEHDRVRLAVRGVVRLADLAGDRAMALSDRIGTPRVAADED